MILVGDVWYISTDVRAREKAAQVKVVNHFWSHLYTLELPYHLVDYDFSLFVCLCYTQVLLKTRLLAMILKTSSTRNGSNIYLADPFSTIVTRHLVLMVPQYSSIQYSR